MIGLLKPIHSGLFFFTSGLYIVLSCHGDRTVSCQFTDSRQINPSFDQSRTKGVPKQMWVQLESERAGHIRQPISYRIPVHLF